MSFDVVIRGATVVSFGLQSQLDVAIADGLIVALGPQLAGVATEEIDAGGLHLLPGVIDGHVHMNEPGRVDWEGFETGTRDFIGQLKRMKDAGIEVYVGGGEGAGATSSRKL